MKLSFIIISWNVRDLLEKCLRSIERHAGEMPYEIIVIDNASSDDSVAMVREKFPSVNLIENSKNRGFAAACNQGIQESVGEYLFLLNPDSELVSDTAQTLVAYLDTHDDVAIAVPQIVQADRSVLHSIQRFPTPPSQIGVLFKIRKMFPGALSHYYADDFDYAKDEQYVDQPDGAALMVRKSVLDHVGIFDEQFFLWFDEVDLCKRIHDAGFLIVYLSRVQVIHHSGRSFAQKGVLEKQRIFFTSCARYLKKHCGLLGMLTAGVTYGAVGFFAFVDAWLSLLKLPAIDSEKQTERVFAGGPLLNRRLLQWSLLTIFCIEILSLASYFYGPIGALVLGAITAVTVLITVWRLEYGIAILFSELIIGSKGYLFSLTVGDTTLSVRMMIFGAVLAGWLLHLLKNRTQSTFLFSSLRRWWMVLGIVFLGGVVSGIMNGHLQSMIFADANAWLFFLTLPVVYDALPRRNQIYQFLIVCTAALIAQGVKVFTVFYVMGHRGFGEEVLTPVYRWVRSTGVGELTQLDSLYRIFFQSHIFTVILFFILLVFFWVMIGVKKNHTINHTINHMILTQWPLLLFFVVAIASLMLSFSRSFWLGAGVMLVLFFLSVFAHIRLSAKRVFALVSIITGSAVCALFFLFAISAIPIPSREGLFSIDLLTDRVEDIEQEAAAASRWNLLPIMVSEIKKNPIIGYGFGKTLTYRSKDPRILLQDPRGEYTTYAFEWGYLDLWLKLGFLGLFVYVLLLCRIVVQGADSMRKLFERGLLFDATLVRGLLFGFCALLIVNFFTPYLNHPLGIGIVMLVAVLFERLNSSHSETVPHS